MLARTGLANQKPTCGCGQRSPLAQAGHWLQLTHSCRQEIRTTGLRAVGHPICKCWGPWPCPCPCPWRWAETSTFSRGTSNATAGAVPARVRRRATSHQTKRCTSASACASLRCSRCFRLASPTVRDGICTWCCPSSLLVPVRSAGGGGAVQLQARQACGELRDMTTITAMTAFYARRHRGGGPCD